MKKHLIYIGVVAALTFSCSNDSEDNNEEMEANNLVGKWSLTDARFEESSSLNFADEALDFLVEEGCFLVSFTFNADGSATSEDRVNYLTFDAGPTGLEVDCPSQSDTETFTWSQEGDQLTLTDENQVSETITIAFEEDNLIIAGEDINAANYSGAEAVFTKL